MRNPDPGGLKAAKSGGGAGQRAERLAMALRDNLRRRKAQTRGRQGEAGAAGGTPSPAGVDADVGPSAVDDGGLMDETG